MVFAPNGDLLVAELNGSENGGTGRVLRLDGDDPSNTEVLQEGLDKPTGIAIAGDRLWIMERRRLSVTSLDPGAVRRVVADDLPFNGRSEGTLTVGPDDTLYYGTSGSRKGPLADAGSGTIYTIAKASSAAPGEPVVYATGFKNPYAHAFDEQRRLWSVEMTDGTYDGLGASDELVVVAQGDDAGWPRCVDDRRPVAEFGTVDTDCGATLASHALFGVGATPTSLVSSPFDPDVLLVALWNRGQVVAVSTTGDGEGPVEVGVFLDDVAQPQHLVVSDGGLLVSDHATGQIVLVAEAGG